MSPTRRALLRRAGVAALAAALPWRAHAAFARVVIVGAGWGGLAAAHALRSDAPLLDVTVVDRHERFACLPLSNPWFAGLGDPAAPRLALAEFGARAGWRFVAGEVRTIDRERRRLVLADAALPYDALVLAPGIASDWPAWFGDDARLAAQAASRWGGGWSVDDLDTARAALQGFAGGDIVMTVPPAPLRCPPAPYERALLIGEAIRRRGLRARLTLLDPGAGMPRFQRLFAERYADVIDFRPFVQIAAVDPFARSIECSEGKLGWDHALLLPPQRCGALIESAGLLARDAQGRATRWAAVQAGTLRSPHDDRIWIVGDALHEVSPLFGAYAKTAHIAADLGAAAAQQIVAASRGEPAAPAALPRSECHVLTSFDPPEQIRLEIEHRRRGDGLIQRSLRQVDNPNPRGEDRAWLQELRARRLGLA